MNLFCRWPLNEKEVKRRHGDETVPYRTPSHLGCAFAVDREFLFEIGDYEKKSDVAVVEIKEIPLHVNESIRNRKCRKNSQKYFRLNSDLALRWFLGNRSLFTHYLSVSSGIQFIQRL